MGPHVIHQPSLLTVEDLARLLNISHQAVYQLRHRDTLPPAIKWGNTLRWRQDEVNAWLESCREGGAR